MNLGSPDPYKTTHMQIVLGEVHRTNLYNQIHIIEAIIIQNTL